MSLRRMDPLGAGNPGAGGPSRLVTNRARLVACALLVLIFVVFGIRDRFAASPYLSRGGNIVPAIQSAITNPVGFAKIHVTGGIGAMLLVDPASGLPQIRGIVGGSPAQRAGLRSGDLIVAVDGVATRGRTLAQDIQCIRGIASVSVALSIQRAGSTNLNCVMHRASWSGMGIIP